MLANSDDRNPLREKLAKKLAIFFRLRARRAFVITRNRVGFDWVFLASSDSFYFCVNVETHENNIKMTINSSSTDKIIRKVGKIKYLKRK